MINCATIQDPYFFSEFLPAGAYPANVANNNLKTKTAVTLNPVANNGILVMISDSQGCNVAPSAYTPSNSNVYNFNICNGAMYQAVDPLLGCSNANSPLGSGNMFTRVGNKVQGTGKFTNTILVPAGMGGTNAAQWGADSFSKIAATFNRLTAAGVTATAVLIELGANDVATTQVAYAASQTALLAKIRLYYAGPIFIGINTWNAGVVNAGVQAAQAAAVNHGSLIWAGANGDTLNATNRQADNLHWNDTGADADAALWLTALQAYGAPFV